MGRPRNPTGLWSLSFSFSVSRPRGLGQGRAKALQGPSVALHRAGLVSRLGSILKTLVSATTGTEGPAGALRGSLTRPGVGAKEASQSAQGSLPVLRTTPAFSRRQCQGRERRQSKLSAQRRGGTLGAWAAQPQRGLAHT